MTDVPRGGRIRQRTATIFLAAALSAGAIFAQTAVAGNGGDSYPTGPRIDVEKYSGQWDGVEFDENGHPKLDRDANPADDFNPSNPPDGDYDTAPGQAVPAGSDIVITFRVTNVGTETLKNIILTDELLPNGGSNPVVRDECNIPTTLRPGEWFTCTGTLKNITALHGDDAIVTAEGVESGTSTMDCDEWWAHPVTPPPPAPRIDIEKHSGAWDGVIFNEGVAQLDEAGQPVNQPAGDYDTAPGLEVPTGASTPVTFTITNTGNEILDDVTVGDVTLEGAPLTGVTCTFGESTSMPFSGLAPGQSFTCTATLGPITAAHADRATVAATGRTSGTTVTDDDAWHASRPPSHRPSSRPSPLR